METIFVAAFKGFRLLFNLFKKLILIYCSFERCYYDVTNFVSLNKLTLIYLHMVIIQVTNSV